MNYPKVTESIPDHLKPFIAEQDSALYSWMDHAAWRFILRISKNYFKKYGHEKYTAGIKETGISTESIPKIQDIDAGLRRFGWRAIGVCGFIPPAVFMEFQSLGVLPIACDMRSFEHIAYTPAPDIVHEAAGHAPIIADVQYSNYLRAYGETARKAIFSTQDLNVYEAIRQLSDVKEDPESSSEKILLARKLLDEALAAVTYTSEATYLARMNWWTVEYGLVGSVTSPKIYGAGLLSSVGESFSCLSPEVRKIPFTLDCVNMSYDITKPQPQLFVAPNFDSLTEALLEFSDSMAYKVGGIKGLTRAKTAGTTTTMQLNSGLQISGVLKNFYTDSKNEPTYIQTMGPTQLSFDDEELPGHSAKYHQEGFGSPIGHVKGLTKGPENLTKSDLISLGFADNKNGRLEFESGVVLEGQLVDVLKKKDKNLVLVFEGATVSLRDEILFNSSWGTFDMACGSSVPSVFGGAADRGKYMAVTGYNKPVRSQPKANLTRENENLNQLYYEVRALRETLNPETLNAKNILEKVYRSLKNNYSKDWLLRLEILELATFQNLPLQCLDALRADLAGFTAVKSDVSELVKRGLETLKTGPIN